MREHIGKYEPGQKVIDLVESEEGAHYGRDEDIAKRKLNVNANGARERCVVNLANRAPADHGYADAHDDGGPCHTAVGLNPEVSDQTHNASGHDPEGAVVEPRRRQPTPQGDRSNYVKRSKDRRGNPPKRHQVNNRDDS